MSPAANRPSEPGQAARDGERERERLLGRAAVVGAGTLVSRVLGLVRDVTLAAVFDREATDAWWVAFTIPNALRSLLGEGAVTSTVVPLLSSKLETSGEFEARRFFARVRGASLVALSLVTVLGMSDCCGWWLASWSPPLLLDSSVAVAPVMLCVCFW